MVREKVMVTIKIDEPIEEQLQSIAIANNIKYRMIIRYSMDVSGRRMKRSPGETSEILDQIFAFMKKNNIIRVTFDDIRFQLAYIETLAGLLRKYNILRVKFYHVSAVDIGGNIHGILDIIGNANLIKFSWKVVNHTRHTIPIQADIKANLGTSIANNHTIRKIDIFKSNGDTMLPSHIRRNQKHNIRRHNKNLWTSIILLGIKKYKRDILLTKQPRDIILIITNFIFD
jgi:hypothetical protein